MHLIFPHLTDMAEKDGDSARRKRRCEEQEDNRLFLTTEFEDWCCTDLVWRDYGFFVQSMMGLMIRFFFRKSTTSFKVRIARIAPKKNVTQAF